MKSVIQTSLTKTSTTTPNEVACNFEVTLCNEARDQSGTPGTNSLVNRVTE